MLWIAPSSGPELYEKVSVSLKESEAESTEGRSTSSIPSWFGFLVLT